MQPEPRFWAVIPAAGVGMRMGGAIPKQYLALAGRTLIEHVLDIFLLHPRIAGVTVAVAADDPCWQRCLPRSRDKPLRIAAGGAQRAHSVLNALHSLRDELQPRDWVLVHDAVRPCLHMSDLERLMQTLMDDPVGGILAAPLVDTVKRVDAEGRVLETPSRPGLWRAFTPQMFRYGLLTAALQAALQSGRLPTDEAEAMEAGRKGEVRVVEGRNDNIKITHPEDIILAEAILVRRAGGNT